MLKFRSEADGQSIIGFGLSKENMDLLLAGKPIMFDAAGLGLPGVKILIVGGATEESIVADMRAFWTEHGAEVRIQGE